MTNKFLIFLGFFIFTLQFNEANAKVYVCPHPTSNWKAVAGTCIMGPPPIQYRCLMQGNNIRHWNFDSGVITLYQLPPTDYSVTYINNTVLKSLQFKSASFAQSNGQWIILCDYFSSNDSRWTIQVGRAIPLAKCQSLQIQGKKIICEKP